MKKTLAFALCLALLCSLLAGFGVAAATPQTTAEVTRSMNYYKDNVYLNGYYWCGRNANAALASSGCGNKYCTCNSFAGAYQCHGFALCLANRIFGSYPAGTLSSYSHGDRSNGWTCYTKTALGTQGMMSLGLWPGDIVRASADSAYSNGHTAIVWKVEGNTVYFAECWGSVYCKLAWGGFNYRSYSMQEICSRYSYVALWRNDSVVHSSTEGTPGESGCTHTYTQRYEDVHPHSGYMQCAKCGDSYYNNTNRTLGDCVCCAGTHSYVTDHEEEHPHSEVMICMICGEHVYTGLSADDDTCPYCNGTPVGGWIDTDRDCYSPGDTVTLRFGAAQCTQYRVEVFRDGVLFCEFEPGRIASVSFEADRIGTYSALLYCTNDNGTSPVIRGDAFIVSAELAAAAQAGDRLLCLYTNTLPESALSGFCAERGASLAVDDTTSHEAIGQLRAQYPDKYFAIGTNDATVAYTPRASGAEYGGFIIELDLSHVSSVTDGAHEYRLFPFALAFNEAQRLCELLGGTLADIADADENELVSAMIHDLSLPGAFIGARDDTTEGGWSWLDGGSFAYNNWSLAYTAIPNESANYAYMYADGAWIDSPLVPVTGSGFVFEKYTEFEYTLEPGGGAVITRYLDDREIVVIPSELGGARVTGIASGAFDAHSLVCVTIPECVTSIAEGALDATGALIICKLDSAAYDYARSNSLNYSLILPFEDVAEDTWYKNAVAYCYENALMVGTFDTGFSPAVTMTRAMFVTVLGKLSGVDASLYTGSSFADTEPGKWYSAYVEWAYREGLAVGYDGRFGVADPLTREQLAVFLLAYDMHNGAQPETDFDLSSYTDEGSISEWARRAIGWALKNSLITGTTASTLSPGMSASRAQVAQIIANYSKNNSQK